MDELEVGEFLKLYTENITTRYDGRVICITGFYREKATRDYGGYYYDAIISKESGLRLTLKLSGDVREQLQDGKNYALRGYINRTKKLEQDSRIGLHFYCVDIKGENKEKKLIHQEDYDLLKERFERGFTDVRQAIIDAFEGGREPSILIITGRNSIVDQDFRAQFQSHEFYNIEIVRVNLSDAKSIVALLEERDLDD